MPDPVVVEQWRRLKATEQYFTLLGTWLLNGRPEMVGERASEFSDMLGDCVATWRHLPQKGKRFRVDDRYGAYLHPIGRAYYQLALMDLFGLLAVERPTVPVKPWIPVGVQHTLFGDTLLPLLARKCRFASLCAIEEPGAFEEDSDFGQRDAAGDVEGEEPLAEMALGGWQSFLQPYFPAYQKSLVLPEPERRDGTFVFRVSLGKKQGTPRILAKHGNAPRQYPDW